MTDANVVAPATPTVVLVHGAFADSSGWVGVIDLLRAAGVSAVAVSNPLRGIAEDTAYVASALAQIPGPVLAVGHSYGGGVITKAATGGAHPVRPGVGPPLPPAEGGKRLRGEGGVPRSAPETPPPPGHD